MSSVSASSFAHTSVAVQRVELGLEASDAEEEGVVREFEDRELD